MWNKGKILLPLLGLLLALAQACGKGGGSNTDEAAVASALVNVTGSVRSVSGGQTEMSNWTVVFLERDTGLCKAALVDPIGKFDINGLRTGKAQTAVLLDTNFRLASVTTYPGLTSGTIRQFFTLKGNVVPALIQNGPTLSFANSNPLTWEKDLAADADLDGIPDGMEAPAALALQAPLDDEQLAQQSQRLAERVNTLGAATSDHEGQGFNLASSGVDTDGDKIVNESDADIDGDGIPNWFDTDDNGNGIFDIFDVDANGDLVVDTLESNSELFYPIGIEYFIVQVAQEVVSGALTTRLIFTVKVRDGESPTTVKVRGPDSLFESSNAELTSKDTGSVIQQAWDGTLADDGLNEDGGANDKLFTRKVLLNTSKSPRPNQVVFAELEYGTGTTAVVFDFPYIFPNLTTGAVSGSYAAATRTVTMAGTPFTGVTAYTWSVSIYDSNGKKVFSSEQIPSATTTYVVPDGTLETGATYTANIIASSAARVPGYPAWFIKSAAISLK